MVNRRLVHSLSRSTSTSWHRGPSGFSESRCRYLSHLPEMSTSQPEMEFTAQEEHVVSKALRRERRRAAHMCVAAPGNPAAPPVVPLSEWRAMTLRKKYALVATLADVDADERAKVTVAEMSDTEMARVLMRLGKEKILRASVSAAENKKGN